MILPPKKNYIPQFLKQRDINSYNILSFHCQTLWRLVVIRYNFIHSTIISNFNKRIRTNLKDSHEIFLVWSGFTIAHTIYVYNGNIRIKAGLQNEIKQNTGVLSISDNCWISRLEHCLPVWDIEKDDLWGCYITVDFAMAASQNDVCMNQQKYHIMIFFRDCSMIKDKSYKKIKFLCHYLKNIWFSYEGMLFCLYSQVLNPFCDASSCKSQKFTVM